MKNLLITGALDLNEYEINEIKSLGYKVHFIKEERVEISIDVSRFDIVVCNSLFQYNDISRFKNLKVIQLTSAGFDRVPLQFIKDNDIKIYNAKNIYSVPIAEWVILKILEIYKKSKLFQQQQEHKIWKKHKNLEEITEKKIAIFGYGDIGKAIHERLKCFHPTIKLIDLAKPENIDLCDFIEFKNFDNDIPKMDVIVLCSPLTSLTLNYFDYIRLAKMKLNSILINVSRGEIINEEDMIKILYERNDISIFLDVFKDEPIKNDVLWGFKNVYITPHNAYSSSFNHKRLYSLIFNNLKAESI